MQNMLKAGILPLSKRESGKRRRRELLRLVRQALAGDSFELYYQPVYDCERRQFRSAEGLIRLRDENGGLVSPGEFIPLAEGAGLMGEISRQVLEKAVSFLERYPAGFLEQLSINLSAGELEDGKFLDWTWKLLEHHRVLARRLRIELTERVRPASPGKLQEAMERLTDAGTGFYLDDFGVGYSNLERMLSLPFEAVKLDASLTAGLRQDERKYRSIRHMVSMLHEAGFLVVAEGIETGEEAGKAKELFVDRIQGFYYARPMPESRFLEFMKTEETKEEACDEADGKRKKADEESGG